MAIPLISGDAICASPGSGEDEAPVLWEVGVCPSGRLALPAKTPAVQLTVAKAPTAKDHEVTLELNTVNAGNDAVLYYAENAAATRSSPRVTGGRISTSAAAVGVLIVDPSRTDSPDAPNSSQTRWTTPLPIAHYLSDPDPEDETRTVTVYAHPQAQLRYTIDGTNPRDHGTPYEGPFKVTAARQVLNVLATITIGDALVFENSESFGIPEAKVGPRDPWEEAAAGRRTSVQRTDGFFLINDRARVYQALDILAGGGCKLFDADLRVSPTDQTGSSFHARLTGDLVMTPDVLRVLLEQAQEVIGEASANIVLRFSRAVADNHTYLRDLDALLVDHVRQGEVLQ